MFSGLLKRVLTIQTLLWFISLVFLGWIAVLGWSLAFPFSWLSVPVILCFGYAAARIIFELTLNRANVPTLASSIVARRKIAEHLHKEAAQSGKDTYNIVDLGSGRGELARGIAKKIPNAKVLGIETAYFPLMQSRVIQKLFGPRNLSFDRCDSWQFDPSPFDAVVLYLGPMTAQRMGEKLHTALKPGCTVISHTYPLMGAWTPVEVLEFRTPFLEKLYLYRR